MLDAIGNSIQHISDVHSQMIEDDVPGKTMFVIITDSLENSSREFTYKKVKDLIEKKKEEGWEFIFLGANIDAASEAERMGIDRDCSVDYHCDESGLKACYSSIDKGVTHFRIHNTFRKTDWREAVEKDNESR